MEPDKGSLANNYRQLENRQQPLDMPKTGASLCVPGLGVVTAMNTTTALGELKPSLKLPGSGGHRSRLAHEFRFMRHPLRRWQLQHGGVLTLAQLRDQDDFPIGELQRVVMHGRLV